jgi:hypothetical protein
LPPWPLEKIQVITKRVHARLKAQGLLARSRKLEELGDRRVERAINLLGPHLLPLINRVEVRLSGARGINVAVMPQAWKQNRRLDRYELVGVVDVLTHIELSKVSTANHLVTAVKKKVGELPPEFEVIVDYKGMRRPATVRRNGRLNLDTYEWQLQNYAHLRERQGQGPKVIAGVLAFLNELQLTDTDFDEWKKETLDKVTDPPLLPEWKKPSDVPDQEKLRRAIHVIEVTEASKASALSEFDKIVQNIEICRGNEASGVTLLNAWLGNPEDKGTCDACDSKSFCPGFSQRYLGGRIITPAIPGR